MQIIRGLDFCSFICSEKWKSELIVIEKDVPRLKKCKEEKNGKELTVWIENICVDMGNTSLLSVHGHQSFAVAVVVT